MKKKITSRGVLIATLFMGISMSLSSCIGDWLLGPKLHYPHFLTAFVKPNAFTLEKYVPRDSTENTYICTIELFDVKNRYPEHFNYNGGDPSIMKFLTSIGDTHYPDRMPYEQKVGRATGLMATPKNMVVTCDHNYSETLKAGTSLNDVLYLSFFDYLQYIQNGYKSGENGGRIRLKDPVDLKRLLASAPKWWLIIDKVPEAWNGETVRFTVTMVLPTDKGDKSVTNSIDVKFPIQSQTPMQ